MKNRHYQQVLNLRRYFLRKATESTLHAAVVQADKKMTPLHMADGEYDPAARVSRPEEKREVWKQKPLHGAYPALIQQEHVDAGKSQAWLNCGNLMIETEGFMLAIQDKVISTKAYKKHIMRLPDQRDDRCRMCGGQTETIEHIIGGCTVLAPREYTKRHNDVAKIVHQEIICNYKHLGEKQPYFKYESEGVIDTETFRLYWNRPIQTDQTIAHNVPDITLADKQTETTYLIDVTIPIATNLERKRVEKMEKYAPLAAEIKRIWNQKRVIIVPIVLGATGEVPKSLAGSLERLGIQQHLYQLA